MKEDELFYKKDSSSFLMKKTETFFKNRCVMLKISIYKEEKS